MKILLAYATNSSGTLVASKVVLEELLKAGLDVTHKEIRNVKPESLATYDMIILGSPSWNYEKTEGMPHEFMTTFMNSMSGMTLPNKQFAVFGLGDTAYMYFCGAVDHIEEFIKTLGGQLVVPSIRIDGFFFNQQENERILSEWAKELIETISTTHQTQSVAS